MVIWPAFRMGQHRVNDHPYHAPQFTILKDSLESNYLSKIQVKLTLTAKIDLQTEELCLKFSRKVIQDKQIRYYCLRFRLNICPYLEKNLRILYSLFAETFEVKVISDLPKSKPT